MRLDEWAARIENVGKQIATMMTLKLFLFFQFQCSLFCSCQSLNIVVEAILDEGDDVTNLYHDTLRMLQWHVKNIFNLIQFNLSVSSARHTTFDGDNLVRPLTLIHSFCILLQLWCTNVTY